MRQTRFDALRRSLRRLGGLSLTKMFYAFALVLVLGGGLLVAFPPSTAFAVDCSADCGNGEKISITGATTCQCTNGSGCTWQINGKIFSASCGVQGPPQ